MTKPRSGIERLREVFAGTGDLAIAVSGGVDSMTLAVLAHEFSNSDITVFHAVSPAVPPEATARVRAYAGARGWALTVLDAGEFADPRYRANPSNRCYFCKTNLYGAIAAATRATVISGTNLDDLDDYRPGLRAASEKGVRHPFVEAGIGKEALRDLARARGLDDLAELPAMPCLSSRVATGIHIEAADLRLVHRVETLVRRELPGARDVRCRIRVGEISVEIDEATLSAMPRPAREGLVSRIARATQVRPAALPVRLAPYVRGSAFAR